MRIEVLNSLDQLSSQQWNCLVADNHPFLKHEFLSALERHHCVGEQIGWVPQHLVVYDATGSVIGGCPLYLKFNAYGELVFDWAWADAYQRHGLVYYPKLVSAVPYTPASGQRLLVDETADGEKVRRLLVNGAIELAQSQQLSSVHWLFPLESEKALLRQQGLSIRLGCQYHWHNRNYQSFEHYLSHFSARKRKNVLKERRSVADAGIRFRVCRGDQLSSDDWRTFHRHYREVFDRKSGIPTLSLGFFEEIGQTLGNQIVLVMAYRGEQCIASALNFSSDHTLYGRHWGCDEEIPNLHFETCYYQGLEYCIRHGLRVFEPGAQGEHKIARGFLPSATWSAHWIAHPQFREAIDHYTQQEQQQMLQLMDRLAKNSPFKQDG